MPHSNSTTWNGCSLSHPWEFVSLSSRWCLQILQWHWHHLAPTCFWWVPLDLHPVEGLCRRRSLRQRWATCLQVGSVQRWQWVWAPGKRGGLLVPAAVGSVGILQLAQGGGTVTLAMLRDHWGGNVTRVHQWAALRKSSCGVYFLVERVRVVRSTETLGSITGAAGRVGPIGETKGARSRLVWPRLVGNAVRGSPARHEAVISAAVVNCDRAGLESCYPVVRVESPDRARATFAAHHCVVKEAAHCSIVLPGPRDSPSLQTPSDVFFSPLFTLSDRANLYLYSVLIRGRRGGAHRPISMNGCCHVGPGQPVRHLSLSP